MTSRRRATRSSGVKRAPGKSALFGARLPAMAATRSAWRRRISARPGNGGGGARIEAERQVAQAVPAGPSRWEQPSDADGLLALGSVDPQRQPDAARYDVQAEGLGSLQQPRYRLGRGGRKRGDEILDPCGRRTARSARPSSTQDDTRLERLDVLASEAHQLHEVHQRPAQLVVQVLGGALHGVGESLSDEQEREVTRLEAPLQLGESACPVLGAQLRPRGGDRLVERRRPRARRGPGHRSPCR